MRRTGAGEQPCGEHVDLVKFEMWVSAFQVEWASRQLDV